MYLISSVILEILFFLLLDQLTKQLIYRSDFTYWFVDRSVGFQLQLNEGVAFSLGVPPFVTIPLAVIVVFLFVYVYEHFVLRSRLTRLVFALFFAGTLGNLVDRVFYGRVIDFIQVFVWPTFNLADSYLVLASVLVVFLHHRIFLHRF